MENFQGPRASLLSYIIRGWDSIRMTWHSRVTLKNKSLRIYSHLFSSILVPGSFMQWQLLSIIPVYSSSLPLYPCLAFTTKCWSYCWTNHCWIQEFSPLKQQIKHLVMSKLSGNRKMKTHMPRKKNLRQQIFFTFKFFLLFAGDKRNLLLNFL